VTRPRPYLVSTPEGTVTFKFRVNATATEPVLSRGSIRVRVHWQYKPAPTVVSKAHYGLYFKVGCSRAPIKRRIGSWIQTSHRRHGVEPNGSVPLWQRRGVACLAPRSCGTRLGGPNGCEPWGHTVAPGLWQGSAACNRTMRILTRSSNRRLRRKTLKWHYSRPL
jgi:hypothetical protein